MPPAGPYDGLQSEISHYARMFLGTPYLYGGDDDNGIDCSGLVVRVYSDVAGMALPHKSSRLYQLGTLVPEQALQAGDLVFFRYSQTDAPDHVGIYLGRGQFIHASGSRGVIISSLGSSYYRNRYTGARRILTQQ